MSSYVALISITCTVIALVVTASMGTAQPVRSGEEDETTATTGSYLGTILISLDGFRHDYIYKHNSSHSENLQWISTGVHVGRLIPQYPSYTFPNHWSIITGLYPEEHGIINNMFYNVSNGEFFSNKKMSLFNNPKWWHGEPLWATVKRQGRRSGAMFWIGNEIEDQLRKADFVKGYNSTVSYEERIDSVLEWLDSDYPPEFTAIYMEETDSVGHAKGPNSPEMVDAINKVDAAIGRLLDGLRDRNTLERYDFVVVSDHGMSELSPSRVIVLDKIPLDHVTHRHHIENTMSYLWPVEGMEIDLFRNLSTYHPHMQVFVKDSAKYPGWPCKEIPSHLRLNSLTPEILLLADPGWSIVGNYDYPEAKVSGGNHGFDPYHEEMGGLFMARGPHFREGLDVKSGGFRMETMANTDVYELICKVMGVDPAPNNGTLREYLLV